MNPFKLIVNEEVVEIFWIMTVKPYQITVFVREY